MPLEHSSSKEAFSRNVAAERKSGRPMDQSLAIAYRVKREGRAMGGPPPASWQVRNASRSMTHSGPIMSAVAGRTDHHPMSVKSGAYVVPAETVSHLGQNNTAAGMAVLNHMFGQSGPYGMGKNPAIKRGSGAPRAPKAKTFADGGAAETLSQPVEINAAGGEYVIPPDLVEAIGDGDVDYGHKILDNWILSMRKDHIRTLKSLPPPAKD